MRQDTESASRLKFSFFCWFFKYRKTFETTGFKKICNFTEMAPRHRSCAKAPRLRQGTKMTSNMNLVVLKCSLATNHWKWQKSYTFGSAPKMRQGTKMTSSMNSLVLQSFFGYNYWKWQKIFTFVSAPEMRQGTEVAPTHRECAKAQDWRHVWIYQFWKSFWLKIVWNKQSCRHLCLHQKCVKAPRLRQARKILEFPTPTTSLS